MIYDLVQGNSFQFKVIPMNDCGSGDEKITDEWAEIVKDELPVKTKEFNPRNMECPPYFETKLNQRGLIVGYGTGYFILNAVFTNSKQSLYLFKVFSEVNVITSDLF